MSFDETCVIADIFNQKVSFSHKNEEEICMLQRYGKKNYWILLLGYLTVFGIAIDLRIPDTDESSIIRLLKSGGGGSP